MLRQCIISRVALRLPVHPNPSILLALFTSQCRTLRTSGPPNSANPLPITAHGPPPKPPLPAGGEITEMRKRQRERAAAAAVAELAGQASESASSEGNTSTPPPADGDSGSGTPQPKSKIGLDMKEPTASWPKPPGPGSVKRFWKESWVKEMPDGTLAPHLDSRPLKTPHKQVLALPKRKAHLAQLIAHEWNLLTSSAQATRAYLLPITSLVSRVIDLPHTGNYDKARKDMVDMCMKYLDTDTLLCLHPPPNMYMISEHVLDGENTLRGKQLRVLADTLAWIEGNVFPGIVIHPLDTAQGFLATTPQPEETNVRIRKWIEERDDWELVGLERCVVSAKSLLVGIRLVAVWGDDKPSSLSASSSTNREAEEGIDTATGGIPPTKDSVLHNRGTNTGLSHESAPHSRPPVARTIDSADVEPGLDIDPITGGIASGDPQENKGTNTGLAKGGTKEDQKEVGSRERKEEVWGIEEAAQAATLEVSWQTEQWGEVEDTHDVEREDVRRGLGAGWCLVINT